MKPYKLLTTLTISVILWILLIFTIFPILALFLIWKLSVIAVAKLFFSNIHPTDINDTYFTVDDAEHINIVNAAQVLKIKGLIDVNQFRKHFAQCFLADEDCRKRYRNFYCYLVRFGGYVFKKSVDELDLEKQITTRVLDPGVDINAFIAKWFLEEKFKEKSPLWEILLLNLPLSCNTEEHETIFLLKSHHCLCDGYSFIHIIDKLTGNSSPYLVKEECDSFYQKMTDAFIAPKRLFDLVWDLSQTEDMFYPLKNPAKQWFISFSTLDLQTVKQVRRQTKTHFTTVMMSLMIGSLRRFIAERRPHQDIPSHIYTVNSLPWPRHPRNTLVNHWSGGIFRLPFATDDPLERLRDTDKFFNNYHDIHMHKILKRYILPASWCVPSVVLRWGHAADIYYFRYSNAFASLMLSDEPYYLLGKKVQSINLPLGLVDNVPTSVLFGVSTSYSNKLDLSFVANTEIVQNQSDLELLTNHYMQKELDCLQKRLQESNNNDFVVHFNGKE